MVRGITSSVFTVFAISISHSALVLKLLTSSIKGTSSSKPALTNLAIVGNSANSAGASLFICLSESLADSTTITSNWYVFP